MTTSQRDERNPTPSGFKFIALVPDATIGPISLPMISTTPSPNQKEKPWL